MQQKSTPQNHSLLLGISAGVLGLFLGGLIGGNVPELLQAVALAGVCFLVAAGMYLYVKSERTPAYLSSILAHTLGVLLGFFVIQGMQDAPLSSLSLTDHMAALQKEGFTSEEARQIAMLERTGQILPVERPAPAQTAEAKPPIFEAPVYNPPVYRPPVYKSPEPAQMVQPTPVAQAAPKKDSTVLFNDMSEMMYSKELSPDDASNDLQQIYYRYVDTEEDVFVQLGEKINSLVPEEKRLATYQLVYHIVASSEEMLRANGVKEYCGENSRGSSGMGNLYNIVQEQVGGGNAAEIAAAIKNMLCHMLGNE
ncbi:MAG: hypothetical protein AAFR61_29840 [Bacteroidota bacterium]